jgi:hypothetical protein
MLAGISPRAVFLDPAEKALYPDWSSADNVHYVKLPPSRGPAGLGR